MTCTVCEHIRDVLESEGLYVVRSCDHCGRKIKVRESGKHGIGIQIRKGDQVVMPAGWLKIAANPLKGSGHLSSSGLDWFASLVFENGWARRRHDFQTAIVELEDEY